MLKRIKAMKLWKKILILCLVLIIGSVAAVSVWQWNNISAVIKTVSNTSEDLAKELDETKQNLENELKEKSSSVVSDFTAEEEKQIMKGEISVDEAVASKTEEYEKIAKEYSVKSTGNAEVDKKVDKLIGDKIIELYSLKAYYLGQLGQLEATVKNEYKALPKEKRGLVGKKELVSKHMGTALSMMNQCDSKVNAIVSELKKELNALGADTSIIKTIQNAYENEKAVKKAYYLKLASE